MPVQEAVLPEGRRLAIQGEDPKAMDHLLSQIPRALPVHVEVNQVEEQKVKQVQLQGVQQGLKVVRNSRDNRMKVEGVTCCPFFLHGAGKYFSFKEGEKEHGVTLRTGSR